MKNKKLKLCLTGSLIAVAFSNLIAIIISFIIDDGKFHPVSYGFLKICSTQVMAVLLQFITMMIFGFAAGALSLIFEYERWSLLKRTIIHFIILTTVTFVTSVIAGWIKLSLVSLFLWLGIFVIAYFIVWCIIYFKTKKDVKEINSYLES